MSNASGASQERARAARILVNVLHRGMTTDQSFGNDSKSLESDRGTDLSRLEISSENGITALVQELVYGSLRHYFTLETMLARHLDRSFRSKDLDLRCLLLVGAYQLHFMRIPDHAAINETVNGCRGLRKPWARAMINAVLRKVANDHPVERSFSLPLWMAEKIDRDFPDEAEAVKAATLDRAPMSLRVNTRRLDPDSYTSLLRKAGIAAQPGWREENLVLDVPVATRSLPGYDQGLVSVQDAGALFAAPLVVESVLEALGSETSSAPRILDACAAPGGKLFHLAELLTEAALVGLELSPQRLAHMEHEAGRLGHDRIRLCLGDATMSDWHDDVPFDAILLDAPCSGSGTMRRHPDIKVLRQPEDLHRYASLQQQMLQNLWPLLNVGGSLIYCTCSLFSEENDSVIQTFLASTPDAESNAVALPVGRQTQNGWQLLPLACQGAPDTSVDGFYFARMTRRNKAR